MFMFMFIYMYMYMFRCNIVGWFLGYCDYDCDYEATICLKDSTVWSSYEATLLLLNAQF
jgi:hypothetical protein